MALSEHPRLGAIVMCNFDPGFREPEMVKNRPVIVISPKIAGRDKLCSVVCLSTTPPTAVRAYHCRLDFNPPLPPRFASTGVWVKGDMIYTVGLYRLNLIRFDKDVTGKRRYYYGTIPTHDLRRVRACVPAGLGLPQLTKFI